MSDEEQQEELKQCLTCDCTIREGVNYYEATIYPIDEDGPVVETYCSVPCLTTHAYSESVRVDLPGGYDG